MEPETGVLDELELAAAVAGPKSKEPPYVRMAFPLIALPVVLRNFVREAADALGVAPEGIATHAMATCAYKTVRRALDAAYPFAWVPGWPFRIWCRQRTEYLRKRFPPPPPPTTLFDMRYGTGDPGRQGQPPEPR